MNLNLNLNELKFNSDGLIPAIVQCHESKDVLMLAYMNTESLGSTLKTGFATYYSRSQQKLWKKGETSGHVQKVKSMHYDCDKDTLLLIVEQAGVACHTGTWSCFEGTDAKKPILKALEATIKARKKAPIEGSYTTYLFTEGLDKVLKKVGEEASEVIIASKNDDKEELINEISDLAYHVLVLMVEKGVKLEEIEANLEKRVKKDA